MKSGFFGSRIFLFGGCRVMIAEIIHEQVLCMDEPSVLDYVKSKIRFWRHEALPEVTEETPASEVDAAPRASKKILSPKNPSVPLPWRSLLALFFALAGQRMFEPPHSSSAWQGILLYFFALTALVLALLHGEWELPPLARGRFSRCSLRGDGCHPRHRKTAHPLPQDMRLGTARHVIPEGEGARGIPFGVGGDVVGLLLVRTVAHRCEHLSSR
jgi:hypothetical protein